VPVEIVDEALDTSGVALANFLGNIPKHLGNDILPAEREARGDAVQLPRTGDIECRVHKATCAGRSRAAIKRMTHILSATNPRDEIVDGSGIGTRLSHRVEIKFEMAGEPAEPVLVGFFRHNDVIDESARTKAPFAAP